MYQSVVKVQISDKKTNKTYKHIKIKVKIYCMYNIGAISLVNGF